MEYTARDFSKIRIPLALTEEEFQIIDLALSGVIQGRPPAPLYGEIDQQVRALSERIHKVRRGAMIADDILRGAYDGDTEFVITSNTPNGTTATFKPTATTVDASGEPIQEP